MPRLGTVFFLRQPSCPAACLARPPLGKYPPSMAVYTVSAFRSSLEEHSPPNGLSPALAALWHDACGDWKQAHELVQAADDGDEAWVHAYLHRKEGDLPNARYWYSKAGRPRSSEPLETEWQSIVEALLNKA